MRRGRFVSYPRIHYITPTANTRVRQPDGYPICLNCNIELGWKVCKQCSFSYCFHCFRLSHNFVGADKHTWTIQEPHMCGLCKKNVAGKRAKGKEFCLR